MARITDIDSWNYVFTLFHMLPSHAKVQISFAETVHRKANKQTNQHPSSAQMHCDRVHCEILITVSQRFPQMQETSKKTKNKQKHTRKTSASPVSREMISPRALKRIRAC